MKRAVLFGCNYKSADGGQYALNGCINDVHHMANWLGTRGYTDIKVICDDGSTPEHPNKQTILAELRNLSSVSHSGDTVFVHYSGHGGQTVSQDGDESDGEDETIYGSGDSLEEITDNELRAALIDLMPIGVRVRCVFDSCHSGSVLDLPYRCITDRVFVPESERPLQGTLDCMELSGCRDDQTSADAFIGGQAQGALTWAFLDTVHKSSSQDWWDTLEAIRKVMSSKGYQQIPQLSVGDKAIPDEKLDV